MFAARERARSEDVADYLSELARHFQRKGYERVEVFLDRNPAHQKKMQAAFVEKTEGLSIATRFHFFPAYSPMLNLTEYTIHRIRQKVLHHAEARKNLPDFVAEIEQVCRHLVTPEQVVNTLEHIERLVHKANGLSP